MAVYTAWWRHDPVEPPITVDFEVDEITEQVYREDFEDGAPTSIGWELLLQCYSQDALHDVKGRHWGITMDYRVAAPEEYAEPIPPGHSIITAWWRYDPVEPPLTVDYWLVHADLASWPVDEHEAVMCIDAVGRLSEHVFDAYTNYGYYLHGQPVANYEQALAVYAALDTKE